MISFSWSGSDPANAGLYMLQRAPAASGPWSNVGDRWPIGVAGRTSTALGKLVVVDNAIYFRLLPTTK